MVAAGGRDSGVICPVSAVVVNHNGGDLLGACVQSLLSDGVDEVIVVDNASTDRSIEDLRLTVRGYTAGIAGDGDTGTDTSLSSGPGTGAAGVRVVETGLNLGYGAAANRGIAACRVPDGLVVVCNPDLRLHPGAVASLAGAISSDRTVAIAGPLILELDGSRYPSARRFPSLLDAGMHATLGMLFPHNRFTKRYRMEGGTGDTGVAWGAAGGETNGLPAYGSGGLAGTAEVDWVSGAFFMARRDSLEEIGGFDEDYFMYGEDVDLCWRAHKAGYGVIYVAGAVVTHERAYSTSRHPYRMLVAHHRSTLRFASKRYVGPGSILLVPVSVVLGARLVMALLSQALNTVRHGVPSGRSRK
ncbi:MAG: glycosyltransferase family 2 protein [Actinobacteria bacterium]|nr:glycosyltransferase family 2 protein [Actinomycetota bacterium]